MEKATDRANYMVSVRTDESLFSLAADGNLRFYSREKGDPHITARSVAYWTTTTLTAFVFLSGGASYLARASFAVPGMAALGYPAYFVTILGAWKVLGGLAIVAPRLPRLKEWAYAGIAFDLTGAAFSHAAIGHPAVKVIVPFVLLGIAAASWALRPASRMLRASTRQPAI